MAEIELLPLKEVRKLLNVSRVTLWRWISEERLSVVKLSPRKIYVKKEELDRFIQDSQK